MAFDVLNEETNHKDFLSSFVALQQSDTYTSEYLDAVSARFETMNAGSVVGSYIPKVHEALHDLIVSNSWVCEDMARFPPAFKHTWANDMVILVKKYAVASGMSLLPFPGAAALFTADGPAVAFIWDMRPLCQRGVPIRDQWKYLMHNMTVENAVSHLEIMCMKSKQSIFVPPTHSIALAVDGSFAWSKVIVAPIICETLYVKEDTELWGCCHRYIAEEIAKMGTKRPMQLNQIAFAKWIGDIVHRLKTIGNSGHAPAPPTAPAMAIADGGDNSDSKEGGDLVPPPLKRRRTAAAAARAAEAPPAEDADVTEQVTDAEAEAEA